MSDCIEECVAYITHALNQGDVELNQPERLTRSSLWVRNTLTNW